MAKKIETAKQCVYPTIRFVAIESRQPNMIFLPDPSLRGRYIYTDRSAALVTCPLCRAIPGEPCKRHYGTTLRYHAPTHCDRRSLVRYTTAVTHDQIRQRIRLKTSAA